MNSRNVLRAMIGLATVTLLLVGCGPKETAPAATSVAEAPIATSTPIPPIPTATPVPPTPIPPTPTATPVPPTPTPSVFGIGDAVELETWKITVVELSQQSSVENPFHSFTADQGFVVQIVRFELENTADIASTLEVDLDEFVVIDPGGKSYVSVGAGMGDAIDVIYTEGLLSSGSISSPLPNGKKITFNMAMDKESKVLGIEMPGDSVALLTFAFAVPIDSADLELHWPGFPPIKLGETTG